MPVLVFNALSVKRRNQHNALLYHVPLNVDKLYILLKLYSFSWLACTTWGLLLLLYEKKYQNVTIEKKKIGTDGQFCIKFF